MGWLVFLIVLIVLLVVLAIVAAKLKSHGQPPSDFPYIKNEVLFSPAERSFLGVLEEAVGTDYRIFGKVRVADVVTVKSSRNRGAWQRAFNRISAKHFDFVLCSQGELTVVAAIELDDKSHQQRKRQERDSFLADLCKAAALPLVQVPAQRAYSVHDIRAQVITALGAERPEPVLELPPGLSDSPETQVLVETGQDVDLPDEAPTQMTESEAPTCPKCSAPMVRRVGKAGVNAVQEFWGCSAFPKCRAIIQASAQHQHAADGAPRSR